MGKKQNYWGDGGQILGDVSPHPPGFAALCAAQCCTGKNGTFRLTIGDEKWFKGRKNEDFCNVACILYNVHCIIYNIHCILYNIDNIIYHIQYTCNKLHSLYYGTLLHF